jgi:hypothetical protein
MLKVTAGSQGAIPDRAGLPIGLTLVTGSSRKRIGVCESSGSIVLNIDLEVGMLSGPPELF